MGGISGTLPEWLNEILDHVEAAGTIKMWDIVNKSIPAGWVVCNGAAVANYGTVPDMRDRFVVGAGGNYAAGTVGVGSTATSVDGEHSHPIEDVPLAVDQIPAHNHRIWAWGSCAAGFLVPRMAAQSAGVSSLPSSMPR